MIGIHLGANYTRVALVKDGYPVMVREIDIPRDGNADRLASVVSFRNGQIRFGTEAFKTLESEIIFDACRAASDYKSDIWHAKRSSDGEYTVRGLHEDTGTISQKDVISKILTRIRDIVKARYKDNFIQSVVLSYPPECIQTYQDMLKDAAYNAGFNSNVELLEDRKAAAITFYKLSPPSQGTHHLLVFKFGAGSFGISVFEKKNGENDFKQLESTSDPNMGGEDITNLLIWYCQENYKDKLEESEIRNKHLRESCERVKSDLSYFAETKIFLDGEPLCDFTRDDLEEHCKNIIEKIEHHLQDIAKKIQNKGININDVLLVGGSTRLHFIRDLINNALTTVENTEYRYDTVVNPEEAIAMGCAIHAENLKAIPDSPHEEPIPTSPVEEAISISPVEEAISISPIEEPVPNSTNEDSLNETVSYDNLNNIKVDENNTAVQRSEHSMPSDLDIEANETTPLNPKNEQNQQDPKSSTNHLRLSQPKNNTGQHSTQETKQTIISEPMDLDLHPSLIEASKNSKYNTDGIDRKNNLSKQKYPDKHEQNLKTEQTNSNVSISMDWLPSSLTTKDEKKRQVDEKKKIEEQEGMGQEEKSQEKEKRKIEEIKQKEKRQAEERRKIEEKKQEKRKIEEMKQEEKEKSQIKQNPQYENIDKAMLSKGSTASSESSESSNYKIKPRHETRGPNKDHGHPVVMGNFSRLTKDELYRQISYWFDTINNFKHISVIEKEHFANYYGKTTINKLPDCVGDEAVVINFLTTAEICYQTLKYKNDILEQFAKIREKLDYIKENKIYKNCLDKLNEKRREVELTTYFTIIDTACDACINDLHQLLGTQQAELKSPVRFANAQVSKWQEDELVKVLIKPQVHQCVYTKGSMSHHFKKT